MMSTHATDKKKATTVSSRAATEPVSPARFRFGLVALVLVAVACGGDEDSARPASATGGGTDGGADGGTDGGTDGGVPSACAHLPMPADDLAPPADLPEAPGDGFDVGELGLSDPSEPRPQTVPVIAEWNRTALPDESFTMTGERFTLRTGAGSGSDTVVCLGFQSAERFEIVRLPVWIAQKQLLTATVPADVPYGMFLVWVKNADGAGEPVVLNRTRASWLGPLGNEVEPGGQARVLGTDLSRQREAGSSSTVWLQSDTSQEWMQAEVNQAEPFQVGFTVPGDAAEGTYQVWTHSGHGGAYGWSSPVTLVVQESWQRGAATMPVAPSGGDDAPALQAAIDAMAEEAGGGTVSLQAGTYLLEDGIRLADGVALRGAGREETEIRVALSAANDGDRAGIVLSGDHIALRDFSLTLVQSAGMPRYGVIFDDFRGEGEQHTNQTLHNLAVRLDASAATSGRGAIGLGRVERLEVAHCHLEVSITGSDMEDVWIHHNQFGGTYHGSEQEAAITSIKGMRRGVVEHNSLSPPTFSLRPEDDELTAKRFVNFARGGSSVYPTEKLLLTHNAGTHVAPNFNTDMNKGEIFLFHSTGADWRGQVAVQDGLTSSLRTDGFVGGEPNALAKAKDLDAANKYSRLEHEPSVVIVGGTGMGQARTLASRTATSFTVDQPWRVPPDASSVVYIIHTYRDIVVYDNHFTAFPAEDLVNVEYSASGLLQADLGFRIVGEQNTGIGPHAGMRISARPSCATYWVTFRNNRIEDNAMRSVTHEFVGSDQPYDALQWPVLLGNRILSNTITTVGPNQNQHGPYKFIHQLASRGGDFHADDQLATPVARSIGNSFEHNVATGQERGILSGGFHHDLFRSNTLTLTDVPTNGSLGDIDPSEPVLEREAALSVLVGNQYTAVEPSDPIHVEEDAATLSTRLVLPFRCLHVTQPPDTAQEYELPVYNAGVEENHWQASTSSTVVRLPDTSGLVAAESMVSLQIVVDTQDVTDASTRVETLTVTGATDSQTVDLVIRVQ